MRGGNQVPLKAKVDAALAHYIVDAELTVRHVGNAVTMTEGRDHWRAVLLSVFVAGQHSSDPS